MKLVDANVLLYAVNADGPHHDEAREWLSESLSGGAQVGFAWVVLLAFVRIATRTGIFPKPLSVADALNRVDAWLAAPDAVVVQPGPDHAVMLRRVLTATGGAGNLTNDAHLAALAIRNHAEVVTFDADFSRFAGVVVERPGMQSHTRPSDREASP